MFKIIYLKVLYRSKSVVKSGSIFKPRYIRFRDISDRVYSVYPMFKRSWSSNTFRLTRKSKEVKNPVFFMLASTSLIPSGSLPRSTCSPRSTSSAQVRKMRPIIIERWFRTETTNLTRNHITRGTLLYTSVWLWSLQRTSTLFHFRCVRQVRSVVPVLQTVAGGAENPRSQLVPALAPTAVRMRDAGQGEDRGSRTLSRGDPCAEVVDRISIVCRRFLVCCKASCVAVSGSQKKWTRSRWCGIRHCKVRRESARNLRTARKRKWSVKTEISCF